MSFVERVIINERVRITGEDEGGSEGEAHSDFDC